MAVIVVEEIEEVVIAEEETGRVPAPWIRIVAERTGAAVTG